MFIYKYQNIKSTIIICKAPFNEIFFTMSYIKIIKSIPNSALATMNKNKAGLIKLYKNIRNTFVINDGIYIISNQLSLIIGTIRRRKK